MDFIHYAAIKVNVFLLGTGSVAVLWLKLRLTRITLRSTGNIILSFWAQRMRTEQILTLFLA